MDEHLAFLQSQAAHIEAQVYQIKYASIQYPMLVPIDTSAAPFAGQITYYSMDGVGSAEFLANRGNDFPFVETSMAQHNVRIENLGIGYDYDMFELGLAQRLGIPLTADKARISRRVAEEKIDNVAINGVPDMGWDGLINQANVSVVDASDGQAGTSQWPSKTALEVLKDCQDALTGIWVDTRQVELADTILLSPTRYAFLAQTPIGDDVNKTILMFLMQHNTYTAQTGQPLMIRTLRELETASAAGNQRMITYRRDMEAIRLHMPMPLQYLEAQRWLTRYVVPGVFRLGGLEIRLPGAFRYTDEI